MIIKIIICDFCGFTQRDYGKPIEFKDWTWDDETKEKDICPRCAKKQRLELEEALSKIKLPTTWKRESGEVVNIKDMNNFHIKGAIGKLEAFMPMSETSSLLVKAFNEELLTRV